MGGRLAAPACPPGRWRLRAAGWLAFAQDMRTLAATFTWLTLLMLAFALLPYIGALFRGRRTP
ncbi:hypothetical protein CTI10_024225 [Delftia acidovorans]|nr:hypothetical protein CTI10_024225 [Delftia acidovorans]